ncbi:MAG TPA: pyrroline-5-carboxylate reductase, partial [Polyangiales bacterium]|nr:pyrroline-5-carboxylate reductase [Polyangiales bacterium]
AERYDVATQTVFDAVAAQADILVFAVKPADISALAREVRQHLTTQVVVSVAAGIRTTTLASWLGGYGRVVWAMPNTPALVGRALTGLYAASSVSREERAAVQEIFEAVGATQWLADESLMDALTAISGCGPAYVCMLVESLQAAARELGFDHETAGKLALHTLCGASWLLEQSGEGPTRLREKITTPRGVTEQAIASLRRSDLDGAISRAVSVARAKSQAIGATLQGPPNARTTDDSSAYERQEV